MRDERLRTMSLLSLGAMLAFVGLMLVMEWSAYRAADSPEYMSSFAAHHMAWVWTFTLVLAAAGIGLGATIMAHLNARSPWQSRGVLCLWAVALGVLAIAALPNGDEALPEAHHAVHSAAAVPTFAAMGLAPLSFGFAWREARSRLAKASRIVGVVMLFGVVVTGIMTTQAPSVAGMLERLVVALLIGWLAVATAVVSADIPRRRRRPAGNRRTQSSR